MSRSWRLAAAAALGAAALTTASAASPLPYLRSVSAQRGHVVAKLALGDLLPGRIAVAVRSDTRLDGSFVAANVRLNEPLRTVKVATGYRARTLHTLRPGRYYVKVSGTALGLDCTPHKPCKQSWSNARRVVIPRP